MQDQVMKSGKWEFDEEVTSCFTEMLSRSIPDYENMRDLVYKVGRNYVKPDTYIIDMGCSNGLSAEPFVKRFEDNCFKLIETSRPMLEACAKRYEGYSNVKVCDYDLRDGLEPCDSSLVLSILTLQFTPIEYRQKIVKSVFDSLCDGGAFVLVEKVMGASADIDEMLVGEYYGIKADHAYTQEQIANKRKSLEGVLVPVTESWNVELLKMAGFSQIDCFWRYLNFCGLIAVK